MKIQINDRTNLLGTKGRTNIAGRVESSFSKYVSRVKSVVLTADDLNGPRGGVDKQCRVLISLIGSGNVAVAAEHESLSQAIGNAIRRAERLVSRKLQKSQRRRPAKNSVRQLV